MYDSVAAQQDRPLGRVVSVGGDDSHLFVLDDHPQRQGRHESVLGSLGAEPVR